MKKIFIVFLTSFWLWYFISTLWVDFLEKSSLKTPEQQYEVSDLDLEDFWKVYNIIEQEYFREGKIEKRELVEGAISGMVDALWDQHSEFMNPELTEKFESTLNGDFEWIWAVVEKIAAWVKIERVLKWSPAKKYDVRSWDILISANGEELQDLDIYDAIDKIKWPAGSSVVLEIIRQWEEKILTIEVIRDKIHIPSVEQEYFEEEDIGYIAINMFWETTAVEFIEALNSVKESQVSGLIIDVRDNGWWYLQSAVQILSEFIPEDDVIVKTKYMDSFFNENYYSVNDGEIFEKKIVVLMNGNSASASEITAGALRDYNLAILLWEQTYGKWSVQQPFNFDNGSLLKLSVAQWFTPKWNSIEQEGIEPDVPVEFLDEDYENGYDRQLEEAKKLLQIFIEKETIGLALEEYNIQKEAEKSLSVNEKISE